MIEITLPWPDKRLNPNHRCHWYVKHQATQDARWDGGYLAVEAKTKVKEWYSSGLPYEVVAHYIFHPPDRRKRDIDNCLAMEKNYQDGVCSALGIDDSCIKRTVLEWGDVVKGGKVVLRLEEMDDER